MFKKSDLVTGDILVVRNGERFLVMKGYGGKGKDTFLMLNNAGWCDPDSFSDDLSVAYNDHYDVMKVLRPIEQCSHFLHEDNRFCLVFDRDACIAVCDERSGFTKSDLRNGQLVKLRDGDIYLVLKGQVCGDDCLLRVGTQNGSYSAHLLSEYDNELHGSRASWDIVEVASPTAFPDITNPEREFTVQRNIVYSRKPKKRISKQEACDELGRLHNCEVEIY